MSSPLCTADPAAFLQRAQAAPTVGTPTASALLMVDPTGFRVSAESARDNAYMDTSDVIVAARARQQFDGVVAALGRLGVPVLVVPGCVGLDDGVYPNNVFGTAPGRFVVGAMRHAVRQAEADRRDVRALFTHTFGYTLHDLSERDCVAELTGVLAIDRTRGVAVCGMTQRVDDAGVRAMAEAFDLSCVLATPLVDSEYHLNIVLAVLAGRAAVLHAPSFVDPTAVAAIDVLYDGHVLHLTDAEKQAFAGNCISVTPQHVMLSATAHDALRDSSKAWFAHHGFALVPVQVDELEKGGGSLRCLLAEVF